MAVERTRTAAQPNRITIGYITGIVVTPAVRYLRDQHPDADLRTLHLRWNEPREALLDQRVDAVVARRPFPTGQLHVTSLYDEPRVLVVARGHRLARKESETLDDIADEPLPRMRQSDPLWGAFWRIDPRPDGQPAPDGPIVETVEDKFELIAAGQAVAIAASPRSTSLHPDLTAIPLDGVEPVPCRHGLLAALVRSVLHRARHPPCTHRRHHATSHRPMGYPASAELPYGSGRLCRVDQVPHPGPRRLLHGQLRRRLSGDGRTGPSNTAPSAPDERHRQNAGSDRAAARPPTVF